MKRLLLTEVEEVMSAVTLNKRLATQNLCYSGSKEGANC